MEDCFRQFDYSTQIFTSSGQKPIPPNCNGLTVTNSGADIVTVDDIVLYPGTVGSVQGDSFSVGGNRNEILSRQYITIMFATTVTPRVTVTFKTYN